jgi:hypothetical protein
MSESRESVFLKRAISFNGEYNKGKAAIYIFKNEKVNIINYV